MKLKNIIYLFAFVFVIVLFYLINEKYSNKNDIYINLIGNWSGIISSPTKQLVIDGKFVVDDDNIDLIISSPTLNQFAVATDSLIVDGNNISFAINKFKIHFKGVFIKDSSKISGIWGQRGAETPLIFYRSHEIGRFNRPQHPFEPYGYVSDSVNYLNSDSIKLAGTFTYPYNSSSPFPTIILVNGLGKHDRDESMYGHKPFLVLSDFFTKNGYAVLRVDDRGVGESEGNFSSATTENFATDLIAAIDFVLSKKNVNKNNIGLIGFNEGGLVASMAIAKRKEINYLVLLSTPGVTGREILLTQTNELQKKSGVSEEEIRRDYTINKKMFDIIESVEDTSLVIKKLNSVYKNFINSLPESEVNRNKYSQSTFNSQIKLMMSPWFKYYLQYNPKLYFEKTECPVLILYGENNLQVEPSSNLDAIKKSLNNGGNTKVESMIFPNLNHLFQKSEKGLPSEYSKIHETFSIEVMNKILKWIENIN